MEPHHFIAMCCTFHTKDQHMLLHALGPDCYISLAHKDSGKKGGGGEGGDASTATSDSLDSMHSCTHTYKAGHYQMQEVLLNRKCYISPSHCKGSALALPDNLPVWNLGLPKISKQDPSS